MRWSGGRLRRGGLFVMLACGTALGLAQAPGSGTSAAQPMPWMNQALTPDQRATMVVNAMTLDEKIQMVHGTGWGVLRGGAYVPPDSNLGAGYVAGIPRLRIPGINLADSALGIRMAALQSRYATLLPSTLGMAASWDPDAAFLYGAVIGRELRAQGFNMSIGGGVDLIREPRNGRNFEYASEDPILSGVIVGQLARGVQSNHVMGDIKHYVLNDQETGRNTLNAVLNRRALQETDLLAFQIAIKAAKPAGVMCSYNRVNGDFACEDAYTLNEVLKKEWGFAGFVLSDWEGTHSTVKAATAGLDMQQPGDEYFGAPLKAAVVAGTVPMARLDDMVHRIVRSMFANGIVDHPPVRSVVDPFRGERDAQHIEEESLVLLENRDHTLPLDARRAQRVAVIGAHADVGVLSGGGSAQVDAPGGNAIDPEPGPSRWGEPVYFPSSPLEFLREKSPDSTFTYAAGTDVAAAARLAASADVAIVFVQQWMSEGQDAPTLALPDAQDALVEAVAAANRHTIVVLETGGPVLMPWAPRVAAIAESWYPGIGGGQAIANVLYGDVNPSGKLPVTFAASDAQLPHPQVTGLTRDARNNGMNGGGDAQQAQDFTVDYNVEGMKVGYRWFQTQHETPLFPFGFGLSYTTFAYSGLRMDAGRRTVTLHVRNTGQRAGSEIAEVYVTLPAAAGEPFRRLAAWQRVTLAPGAEQEVTMTVPDLFVSIFDIERNRFRLLPGEYRFEAGPSPAELPLAVTVTMQ